MLPFCIINNNALHMALFYIVLYCDNDDDDDDDNQGLF